MKKIVVGLGNPGSRYEKTRHNMGWLVLDRLADRVGAGGRAKSQGRGRHVRGRLGADEVILVKPMTYMNLSGVAVRKVLARERVPMEDLLVVVDDMALPFGRLRLRERGSAGGHNGLRSIIGEMGTEDFARLRVGIGEPQGGRRRRTSWATSSTPSSATWRPSSTPPRTPSEHGRGRAPPGRQPLERLAAASLVDGAERTSRRAADSCPRSPRHAAAAPISDGIVRTTTGWRKLLPGRGCGGQGACT